MVYSPPVVIYDACVLYPFHLRNVLIQCAVNRLVDARWTNKIHDEWIENLLDNNPRVSRDALNRTRTLMDRALPQAQVSGYEHLISEIDLEDASDRHVVAAGITAQAEFIVTWNVRDFPTRELSKHGLASITPDEFLMKLYGLAPELLIETTAGAFRNLTRSGISAVEFVQALDQQRLLQFAKTITSHVDKL